MRKGSSILNYVVAMGRPLPLRPHLASRVLHRFRRELFPPVHPRCSILGLAGSPCCNRAFGGSPNKALSLPFFAIAATRLSSALTSRRDASSPHSRSFLDRWKFYLQLRDPLQKAVHQDRQCQVLFHRMEETHSPLVANRPPHPNRRLSILTSIITLPDGAFCGIQGKGQRVGCLCLLLD